MIKQSAEGKLAKNYIPILIRSNISDIINEISLKDQDYVKKMVYDGMYAIDRANLNLIALAKEYYIKKGIKFDNLHDYFYNNTSHALGTSNIHKPGILLIEDRGTNIPDMIITDSPARNIKKTKKGNLNRKATLSKANVSKATPILYITRASERAASKLAASIATSKTASKRGGKGIKTRRKRKTR